MTWIYYLATALSLSVGWGIRGNFGHEYGALYPGALAALAIAVLSGREDWAKRAVHVGFFGALGWSFGGSISYMQVVAYTHSGHSPTVLYGFACLFVIGFLWAAPGGAGTALGATIDKPRLDSIYSAVVCLFIAWWLQGLVLEPLLRSYQINLNWYDTDWIAATVGILVGLIFLGFKGQNDSGTLLILYMSIGWWSGFLILVLILGLRMTPPRGDNWSGCLGMTVGMFLYCRRLGLVSAAYSGLVTGVLGGIGFAAASMLKLVEVTSKYETNWHSILEQTTGLFNGLAVAVAMASVSKRTPMLVDPPRHSHWREIFAAFSVLVGITYVNLAKNPSEWVKLKVMPPTLYGLPPLVWFDIGYAAIAIAVIVVLARHVRRPIESMPNSPIGRAQLLFLGLNWWMIAGNLERVLPRFADQRLITEGVIQLNATLCSVLLLLGTRKSTDVSSLQEPLIYPFRKAVFLSLLAVVLTTFGDWAIVRAIYGETHAGHSSLSIRFGPNATTTRKP